MSSADILAESQAYLLGTGDPVLLPGLLQDALAGLAQSLPLFGEVLVNPNIWVAGTYDSASTVYTDATPAAQDGGTFPLATLTPGDGHLLGASGLFPRVTYTISTVDSADGIYQWEYWSGSQWELLMPSMTPNFGVLGMQMLVFDLPATWVRGAPTDVLFPLSMTTDLFWLRCRTTTAPALFAPVASLIEVTRTVFPLPPSVIDLLSVHYYPSELEPIVTAAGLDLLTPAWRTRIGTPTRYTQEVGTTETLRLIPVPETRGQTGLPPFTNLPGAVSPVNSLVTFLLQSPGAEGLPDWIEGLLALDVAVHSAAQEGDQQNPLLAGSLRGVYTIVSQLVRAILQDVESAPESLRWRAEMRR